MIFIKFKIKFYDKNIILVLRNKERSVYFACCILWFTRENIINTKEIFGPILSILTFENDQEAIRLANDTNYGLSSIICCKNKQS